MKLFYALSLLLLFTLPLAAQTGADARLQGFSQRTQLKSNSIAQALNPQSIGPSVFSCRVTDVDVNPADPSKFYVAYASGGLWYTESNGASFKPVFEHEAAMTIGDIAVDWQRNVIWVGTGEVNSSRSSYAGTGIYRSADGGKTWQQRGLPESHHIGRIVLHPTNPDILWVAVLGHLYTDNPERGVFKTTDGGKTWQRSLFVHESAGAVDLVADPQNPDILYAAIWQRTRKAWNFDGAGAHSGIWKSTDGGANWSRLSNSGFPDGPKTGRIGLTAGVKNGKTVLYACLDNQNSKPKKEDKKEEGLTKDQLRNISKADFLKLGEEQIADYLKRNNFPEKYSAGKVKSMVEQDKIRPAALVEYLEDANNNLFETDFIGAEVYRSDDNGKTWTRTHNEPIEQMYFTYGYYFASIACAPNNPDQLYLLGFLIIRSDDGGKTWKNINGDNVHPDHHAIWVNTQRPGHLINGNDGGLNISYDNGESWFLCNNPPVGQFYAIAADEAEPYNVYGGAQDNGVWYGPSNYKASTEWHQNGKYPYQSIMGGDGMQIAVDTRDNNTVYTGYQFGNYFRIDKRSGKSTGITPEHELGERPLRFNWQTPIHLSRHQQDVLYFGANRLYRSLDKGNSWEAISEDLTGGGKPGNVPYGTLTSIHESPLRFGLLYAGSDDGRIHVSRNGGDTWTRIDAGLPQELWVSRVQASAHERGRVYASLNGYRNDDFTSYVFVSENYGATWTRIGSDLPAEPVNVLKEDPKNPDLLFVGTDHNVYFSLDRGKSFQTFSTDFPDVPVHDLVVQAKAADLLIGTHGRSMYKVNIAALQELNAEALAATIKVFEVKKTRFRENWGKKQAYQELKDPEAPVLFYTATAGNVSWSIYPKEQRELILNQGKIETSKGLNFFKYTLDIEAAKTAKYQDWLQNNSKDKKKTIALNKADTGKIYLRKGVYILKMEKDGKTAEQTVEVE
ncbi:MAG: hypothetical protein J0L99_03690 [Chitinophagales bacterium]|nr:hypothetical protein [Chitinophagales bacterium]